mgnify:CR=1 FL=1
MQVDAVLQHTKGAFFFMEAKTMGKLIAALRKANGMTQKDLAEKLNVSDKSVSRWERDEGAPDLSLIPVIAEIFGVTCDELLRGERKPEDQRQDAAQEETITPKAEKQRKHMLKTCLAKYRSRALIAVGIALLGMLAAMICNGAFQRAYLGFFVGSGFYLAAVVFQLVLMNGTLLNLADDEEAEDVKQYRSRVLHTGALVIGLCVVLFAATLPLIVLPWDAYIGLIMGDWLAEGLKYGIFAGVICFLAGHIVQGFLVKKEPGSKREKNWRLKSRIAAVCAVVMLLTAVIGSRVFDADLLVDRYSETFADFDSFKAFIETRKTGYDGDAGQASMEEVYYDEAGNPISQEEVDNWLPEDEVRMDDGTPEGKVLGSVKFMNPDVVSYSVERDKDGNPNFFVATEASYEKARHTHYRGVLLCAGLCLAEAGAAMLVYKKKKA